MLSALVTQAPGCQLSYRVYHESRALTFSLMATKTASGPNDRLEGNLEHSFGTTRVYMQCIPYNALKTESCHMMLTLSSLGTSDVVIMTTSSATNDDKV